MESKTKEEGSGCGLAVPRELQGIGSGTPAHSRSADVLYIERAYNLHTSVCILLNPLCITFKLLEHFFPWIFFFFGHTACRNLVPQPGTEAGHPALGAQSLNHWTARGGPLLEYF